MSHHARSEALLDYLRRTIRSQNYAAHRQGHQLRGAFCECTSRNSIGVFNDRQKESSFMFRSGVNGVIAQYSIDLGGVLLDLSNWSTLVPRWT